MLSDRKGVYSTPEVASTWPLDDVMEIKRRQHEPRSANAGLAEAMIPPAVERGSAKTAIEKLIADQLDDIPEVSLEIDAHVFPKHFRSKK